MRICAKDKGVELCALCESCPCAHFDAFFAGYPLLRGDNALLREKGMEELARLQDERRLAGYTYAGTKSSG